MDHVTPSAVADLVAVSAEYRALFARNNALGDMNDYAMPPRQKAAWNREQLANIRRRQVLLGILTTTPACTSAAIRAKAAALKVCVADYVPLSGPEGTEHALAASLAADLLGQDDAEPDAHLLSLVADIERVQARIDVMNGEQEPDDAAFDGALAEFWTLADQIAVIPARAPEGIAGKAKTLRYVHQGLSTDQTGHIARHMLGLVRDLVGEG
jgi:hypothetical protein